MSRMSADERRETFVAAAVRVMAREGLERATTRRIAEEAGAPQGAFHYLFDDKNQLLTEVVGAVTLQVEEIVREAVDVSLGLAAAIDAAVRAFWSHVTGDDGLQLMQYELVVFCRRTEGFEWLADWQYERYTAAARDVLHAAAEADDPGSTVDIDRLARFLVAALDGLVIQYEVHHDLERSEQDVSTVIEAATLLTTAAARR